MLRAAGGGWRTHLEREALKERGRARSLVLELVQEACGERTHERAAEAEPAQARRAELIAQSQGLQRTLNNARSVANNLPAFEAEVAGLERDLDLALKQLPNRKQFEDLLQDISTAGKKVGVSIKTIDRNEEVEREFYAEVPFNLELEGTYHDLARFFEMVATLPRIVNVGALEIDVQDEARTATRLKVSGKATTFRFLSGKA